ncbi:141aa long hypothetical protein [Pyrococcus horikoshii OT3]|uniref:Uncharacterized protein n=1 Tax=Pyrococcus horikoshii (strain ATCC 700860 / DSM 12428 / JCM 9974 / NBRC 100139 / OT-3) TaxID=70601 RepID=O58152_PYRHO|nr:141aa long hypothetical protein [Pyrococcus horikoshii OT3]
MGEPPRNVELVLVVFGQNYSNVLPKRWRVSPQVHCNIIYNSPYTSNYLGLGIGSPLKVQAPKDTVFRLRMIILHKLTLNSRLFEVGFFVGLHKETPFIFKNLWLYQDHIGNFKPLELKGHLHHLFESFLYLFYQTPNYLET